MTTQVLVIDDDDDDVLLVREWLGNAADVHHVSTMTAALDRLRDFAPDAVLLDYRLGAENGLELLARIRERENPPPVLIVTGQGDEEIAVEALQAGATDYLVKSRLNAGALRAAVSRAVELSQAQLGRIVAETARRRSEERYRRVFDVSLVANAVASENGWISHANAAFNRLLRTGDARGASLPDHAVERTEVTALLRRAAGGEAIDGVPLALRAADGTAVHVLASLTRLSEGEEESGLLAAFLDVTASRQLEEQLRISQRMEALGRLAGGIAHDFNNLLTSIQGHAELARTRVPPTDDAQRSLAEIIDAAGRGAQLTQQLLSYSRRQGGQPQILEPDVLLKHLETMLARIVGEDVQLSVARGAPGVRVRVDPVQLEQVLLNLVSNARDAMPEGGAITLSTRVEQRGADGDLAPGEYLVLAVTDSGSGMAPEVRSRLFEPYFTTKDIGQGSGLGLATALGIVTSAGGTITVDTVERQGTTVQVLLPTAVAPLAALTSPEGGNAPSSARGRGTVLVVEDDAVLRELTSEVLSDFGYEVLQAGTGKEALDVAARGRVPDVLLTDIVLPDAAGPELAKQIKTAHRDVRVVFMSGYGASAAPDGASLLAKPFTFQELESAIERALMGRG